MYGQNCGEHSLSFTPIVPACDPTQYLSLDSTKNGVDSINNNPYYNAIVLSSDDPGTATGSCGVYYHVTSDGFIDKNGSTRQIP